MADIERIRELPPIEEPQPQAATPAAGGAPDGARRRLPGWPLMLIMPAAIIAFWYASSRAHTVVSKFIPSPAEVLETGYDIFTRGYRGSFARRSLHAITCSPSSLTTYGARFRRSSSRRS